MELLAAATRDTVDRSSERAYADCQPRAALLVRLELARLEWRGIMPPCELCVRHERLQMR